MSLDLSEPIRTAIVSNPLVTGLLPPYADSFPVFTRRPVPDDAIYPMIVVSQDVSVQDQDGVDDFQPIVVRDIAVYGKNDLPGDYRRVLRIAYLLRTQFHRQRLSLSVDDYQVTDVRVTGMTEAPLDDQVYGRNVELTVRLNALR